MTLTVVWFVTTSQQWAVFSNGCPSFCSTQQTICHLQCSLTMNLLLTNLTENFLRIMLCFEVACNIQAECVECWLIRTLSLSLSLSVSYTTLPSQHRDAKTIRSTAKFHWFSFSTALSCLWKYWYVWCWPNFEYNHGWISCNLFYLNQLSTTLTHILMESVQIAMISVCVFRNNPLTKMDIFRSWHFKSPRLEDNVRKI